jgi:large subunit ribosomal protein L14e
MECKMFNVGRICVKIAGRDAGQKCVIVEVLDDKHVMIDGMTRRRKCNKIHLEPLSQTLDINSKASHEEVAKAFKSIDLDVRNTKPKQKTEKPKVAVKDKTETQKKGKKSFIFYYKSNKYFINSIVVTINILNSNQIFQIMRSIDAEIVVLRDYEDIGIELPHSNICLEISEDDKIHYDNSPYNDIELKDNTLTLWDYNGRISVPKHVGICIFDTAKKIFGTISSPTHIDAGNDITLKILKESNLELCLATNGIYINNGRMITTPDNLEYYYERRAFDTIAETYHDAYESSYAYNSKRFIMEVCMFYNLINIENTGKFVRLEYDPPKTGTIKERTLNHNKNQSIRLERELLLAVKAEDYLVAAEKKRELQMTKKRIEELTAELAGTAKSVRR